MVGPMARICQQDRWIVICSEYCAASTISTAGDRPLVGQMVRVGSWVVGWVGGVSDRQTSSPKHRNFKMFQYDFFPK